MTLPPLRSLGYPLKLLVSAGILLFLLSRIDLVEVLHEFGGMQPSLAAAAMALLAATHAVNALKLGVLLPERRVGSLFAYTLIAQAYALLLPGQIAGEAVKAYRLSRGNGAEAGGVVSAVVFDKLVGGFAILLLSLTGLLTEPTRFGGGGAVWATAAALGILLLSVAALAVHPVQTVLLRLFRSDADGWRGWIGRHLSRFLESWRAQAMQPRTVALCLAYGVLSQTLTVAGCVLFGMGLGIDLGYAIWCVIIGMLTVVLLAPLTIGGLGLREISLVGMLGHFGVAPDRALALSLAIFAFQIMVAVLGIAVDLLVLRERRA
ncbi:lysylphosphatidylglycerol synthase transmembrane domain-containing protein [Azospirillum doebereinerae]|uniref:lysylphosphatidylglycerol synthase transmembrane domain-containing protein n=1 Tax=Azospirillum doebereinerae TaxID=92933 RepID=UPI001EE5DC53|nr:lysylphosphatidylglycerol synthase transmembrane domain-containing protein [Azospirillum doebereinerae]MCG5238935.1 flippase-like domain-containing protein [Azospirillum doebereinerae]